MANLRDIFDKPFAGPEMGQRYAAALGHFLVKFNAVENYMRFTAEEILKSVDQQNIWTAHLVDDDFLRQIKNLRLLVLVEPFFDDLPFDRLVALNTTRNKLAHAHFEQDLFSEDFDLVGRKKTVKMTIEQIEAATAEADDIWQELGQNLGNYWQPALGP